MSVGVSVRTRAKHVLMDKILGREVGVVARASRLPYDRRYLVVDLTAGDGVSSEFYGRSSAEIADRHRQYLADNGVDCTVVLVERDPAAFQRLASRFTGTCLCIRGDSSEPHTVSKSLWTDATPVFVSNDPNNVTQFALSDQLMQDLPLYTTTLSTLGCNASGVKRAPRDVRDMWRDHVNRVASTRAKWHTAILIALRNDDSQWAYLITGPRKWREKYEADARTAFRDWPNGIDTVCIDDGVDAWEDMLDRLFLTKRERHMGAQPSLFGEVSA